MPFSIPTAQCDFSITLTGDLLGGLPLANIIQLGNACWIEVCPCCGCIHELPRNAQPGDVLKPLCAVKTTHPTVYKSWLERFPQAAVFRHVLLTSRDELKIITPPASPQKRRAGE